MALTLSSKAPAAVLRYGWVPAIIDGDFLDTSLLSVTSGSASIDSYGIDDDAVYFFLSGGAASETTIISATATTGDGETLRETLYVPIRETGFSITPTARDIADFALRKVVGNADLADAVELDDALERLTDMLAAWRAEGADLAVNLPIGANDVLYVPDWALSGIKACLTERLFDHYDLPIPRGVAMDARAGKQRVKAQFLPAERRGEEYF